MIRSALAYALADKVGSAVLTVAMMVVVSRLLTPAEVGLFFVSGAIVILIEAFRDFGLAACLIQERDLTRPFAQTAATVMTLLSLVLGAAIFALSGVLATAYGEDGLGPLIRIAAIGFLFAPIATPRLALLRRGMAFGPVALIGLSATGANVATSIGLAASGHGAQSLAWGSVVSAFVAAAIAFALRPEPWLFRPTLVAWRGVIGFGAWSSVVTLLGMFAEYLPRVILGRVLGVAAVGLYGRALSLAQMPERMLLPAAQSVVLPAMAARVRAREGLAAPYLMGLAHLTALQWPALVVLAILADPVVRLLLGEQWLATIPLVRIFALAGLLAFPGHLAFPVLVAVGRIREMAFAFLLTIPLALAVLYGAAPFGLTVVAWSVCGTIAFQSIVVLLFVRRFVPFALAEIGGVAARSGAVAAATAVVPLAMVALSGAQMPVVSAGLAVVGAWAGWHAGLALVRHPLHAEILMAARHLSARLPRRGGRGFGAHPAPAEK
ncbi:oligosaccharide flippase family protein [Acuticoccus kandeliae]|uniref:oligosaccharide flippase family protein n=1 Tax=Acuticoccus kandeliae TaxID=2073160 RepID=UPI000D3E9AF3|nr:oligosaccharide flippase family protein [Acuticoccus kandeliae]